MKLRISLLLVVSLIAVASWPWSHAALVSVITNEQCASRLLDEGRERAAQRFAGGLVSEPVIACVGGPTFGLDVSHATTRIAPLLPSIIVFGPSGRSTDVVAHELVHAELAQRLGALRRLAWLPTWFDEGFAMQVDHRPDYGRQALAAYLRQTNEAGALTLPQLNEIDTPGNFFQPGEQGKLHYALARCVVERWLQANPEIQPINWLTESMAASSSFPQQAFISSFTSCSDDEYRPSAQ